MAHWVSILTEFETQYQLKFGGKGRKEIPKMSESNSEPVIRISATGYMTGYLKFAHKLVDKLKSRSIKIIGSGSALENVVLCAELVKRSFPGLHQTTTIGVREHKDSTTEDDEIRLRLVSHIEISLSFDEVLDKNHIGYQSPIDPSLVQPDQTELLKTVTLPRCIHGTRKPNPTRRRSSPTVAA